MNILSPKGAIYRCFYNGSISSSTIYQRIIEGDSKRYFLRKKPTLLLSITL